MTNRLIELHDSEVLDVAHDGDDVMIPMSAYVHASVGRPGIDAGTGWTQPVRVTIFEGCVVRRHEGDRLWILEGVITVSMETLGRRAGRRTVGTSAPASETTCSVVFVAPLVGML